MISPYKGYNRNLFEKMTLLEYDTIKDKLQSWEVRKKIDDMAIQLWESKRTKDKKNEYYIKRQILKKEDDALVHREAARGMNTWMIMGNGRFEDYNKYWPRDRAYYSYELPQPHMIEHYKVRHEDLVGRGRESRAAIRQYELDRE